MSSGRITLAALIAILTACSGSSSQHTTGGAGAGGPSGGSTGAGGTGTGFGGTGSGNVGGAGNHPANPTPTIVTFQATPPTLPSGGGQSSLQWTVQNADSLSIDQGVGTVTGMTSANVNVTATTIYTLTATNSYGTATASTAVVIGQNPSTGSNGRFAAMVSPTGGESFIAPATLRLVGAGRNPDIDTNQPTDGLGGNAQQVQFFVDNTVVLTELGSNAEYWIFKGFTSSTVAAGTHTVWLRATYTNPAEVLDSPPMIITVANAPTYGKTMDLSADVTVSGSGFSLVGTASSRVRLNGHGHTISGTGPVTLQFVDVFDLGDESDTSQAGINVNSSGAVTIEDSTFDTSNTVSFSLSGAASASIQRNTFRSNMRQPIGQDPFPPSSYPAVHFDGTSSGTKVFAGNNVGAGWVEFLTTSNWTIGGDTDAASNVFIGPRVGISTAGSNIQVRRNFSNHVYYGGWSQGANFEIFGTTASTVEHNVIYNSSWPIRGGGTGLNFQYNLVLEAGHEWMQPAPGDSIHHNVFIGGDEDQGGLFIYNDPTDPSAPSIGVFNNTFDGQNGPAIIAAVRLGDSSGPVTVSSNAFLNYPTAPIIGIEGGTLTADYNGFFASITSGIYQDNRTPAHDIEGANAKLTSPPTTIFSIDVSTLWTRSTSVATVLSIYRADYLPMTGSPLLGAGDPAVTSGNWIGAVGSGQATDLFGKP